MEQPISYFKLRNIDLIKLLQALPPEEDAIESIRTIEKHLIDIELRRDLIDSAEIISDIFDDAISKIEENEAGEDPHTHEHDFIPSCCFDKYIFN